MTTLYLVIHDVRYEYADTAGIYDTEELALECINAVIEKYKAIETFRRCEGEKVVYRSDKQNCLFIEKRILNQSFTHYDKSQL